MHHPTSKLDGKTSLATAGENKLANYDWVYGGGLIAAITLDIQIRYESGNSKILDSLLPYLLQRFPRTPVESDRDGAASLTLEKLFEAARSLYGPKIAETFERYVRSSKEIPFDKIATLAGLNAVIGTRGKSIRISRMAEPTVAQETVWIGISGKAVAGR